MKIIVFILTNMIRSFPILCLSRNGVIIKASININRVFNDTEITRTIYFERMLLIQIFFHSTEVMKIHIDMIISILKHFLSRACIVKQTFFFFFLNKYPLLDRILGLRCFFFQANNNKVLFHRQTDYYTKCNSTFFFMGTTDFMMIS